MSVELQVLLRQRQLIDSQVKELIRAKKMEDMDLLEDIGRYMVEELLASDGIRHNNNSHDIDENLKTCHIIARQVQGAGETSFSIGRGNRLLKYGSTIVILLSSTYQLIRCIHIDRGLIKQILCDDLEYDMEKPVRFEMVLEKGEFSDLTSLAREIWNRNEITNSFEKACIFGTSAGWCWSFGCTTCGNHDLRMALSDIAKGRPVRQSEAGRGDPRNSLVPLVSRDLERLCDVCATADLKTIAKESRFPDWLGFMGQVMNMSQQRGRDYIRLCDSWSNQLIGMVERTSPAYERLKLCNDDDEQILQISDLELCERGMREEYINRR